MKELLANEKYMYILEEDDCGALLLTVTCGGVGMYDIKIQLNSEERENYLSQGEVYLNNLACQIGKNTFAFQERAMNLRANQ
jgi:hypothetical protein